MAVTGAFIVLSTLPCESEGRSLSFAAALRTNTTRIGWLLAPVGGMRASS